MLISIFVPGVPIPKGSSRAFINKRTGRAIITAANSKTKPWEQAVAATVRSAIRHDDPYPFRGPVALSLTFFLPRPKKHFNKQGIRPDAPVHHAVKPDLDKLIRSVSDALTVAGVWQDDSQAAKVSAGKQYQAAGDMAGCWIEAMTI